jgi:hypothetical protein
MHNLLVKIEKTKLNHLYFILFAFSALLAARIQYIQHGWINPDTVLYFESARLISLGDFKEAIKVFNWPLYSFCIATVHKLTSISIHQSAQLLNVIFFSITTISFTKIIELGGGNKKTMLTGALILFSSLYIVGDVLEMLMRDQGFWACFLSSLIFFIRFITYRQYRDALLWQILIALAMLFRIEAIMYLIFLPFLLLLDKECSWQKRIANLIKCNFLNITLAVSIIIALCLSEKLSMSDFGRLQEIFTSRLVHEMTALFVAKSLIMSQQVLGQYLEEFATVGLLMTFVYVMFLKTITTTGIINVILVAFSRAQKGLIKTSVCNVLKLTAIIAVTVMALIIYKRFVLSSRYIVALAFVLMIPAAFQLEKIITKLSENKIKSNKLGLAIYAILIIMLGCLIKNVLPKANGYNYMQQAVSFVKVANQKNEPVFYNEPRLRYYANEDFIGTWPDNYQFIDEKIQNNEIIGYKYLLITYSNKNSKEIDQIRQQLKNFTISHKVTDAKGKKGVLIFVKKP